MNKVEKLHSKLANMYSKVLLLNDAVITSKKRGIVTKISN